MPLRIIESVEELQSLVGQEAGVTEWIPIEQERVNQFADVTGDHQWIHVDTERAARESPYGTTVAHGFMSLSLLSRMASEIFHIRGPFTRGINYGLNRVRFPAPVPVGARLRGRFTLQTVEEIEGGVHLTWNVRVEADGSEKPCVVAEWVTRAYR